MYMSSTRSVHISSRCCLPVVVAIVVLLFAFGLPHILFCTFFCQVHQPEFHHSSGGRWRSRKAGQGEVRRALWATEGEENNRDREKQVDRKKQRERESKEEK